MIILLTALTIYSNFPIHTYMYGARNWLQVFAWLENEITLVDKKSLTTMEIRKLNSCQPLPFDGLLVFAVLKRHLFH